MDVELIVVDGGTGDALTDVTNAFGRNLTLVSEPDKGIYDAMNKGTRLSTGRYVWYLNGGDLNAVESWMALKSVLQRVDGRMVFGSYSIDFGAKRRPRKSRPAAYIRHGLPTSHQAILYPGTAMRRTEYDLEFDVVGDYEVTARLLKNGMKSIRIEMPLAVFTAGGMSQVNAKKVAYQAAIVQRRVLKSNLVTRSLSQVLHFLARTRRSLQTRPLLERDPASSEPAGALSAEAMKGEDVR